MNVQFKTPKNVNRFFFGNPTSQVASTTAIKRAPLSNDAAPEDDKRFEQSQLDEDE